MGALSGLSEVYLQNNHITKIPTTLGSLTNLKAFSVANNEIDGPLPDYLNELPSLKFIDLSSNLFSGSVGESWQDFCFPPRNLTTNVTLVGSPCYLMPNKYMCDDRERLITTKCVACENCKSEGECYNSFDSESYLCTTCTEGEGEGTGTTCLSCAELTSSSMFYIAYGVAMVVLIAGVTLLQRMRVFTSSMFSLGSQMRARQLASILQMISLLPTFSLVYPEWFTDVTHALQSITLPLPINTTCYVGLANAPRWQQGLVALVVFYSIIAVMVFSGRAVKWCSGGRLHLNLTMVTRAQVCAGFLVSQSVLILLPLSFNPIRTALMALEDRTEAKYNTLAWFHKTKSHGKLMGNLFGEFAVMALVLFLSYSIINQAKREFEWERKRVVFSQYGTPNKRKRQARERHGTMVGETVSESDDNAAENTMSRTEAHVDSLFPFWSTFVWCYTPRGQPFETKAVNRKVLSFLVPFFVKIPSLILVGYLMQNSSGHLGDGFPAVAQERLTLAVDAMSTMLFIIVQTVYIWHAAKRPFVSSPTTIGSLTFDAVNDTEVWTTRILCWSALALLLKQGAGEVDKDMRTTGDTSVLCAIVLAVFALAYCVVVFDACRRPTEESNDEGAEIIRHMKRSETQVDLFRLQSRLREESFLTMDVEERHRWIANKKDFVVNKHLMLLLDSTLDNRMLLLVIKALILSFLSGFALCVIFVALWITSFADKVSWLWVAGAIFAVFIFEVVLFFAKRRATIGLDAGDFGEWEVNEYFGKYDKEEQERELNRQLSTKAREVSVEMRSERAKTMVSNPVGQKREGETNPLLEKIERLEKENDTLRRKLEAKGHV